MGLIEYIGSIGGVTGVLAFVMFLIYRQDRKYAEDKFIEIIKDYNETIKERTKALVENTKVQAELYTYLKAKNGKI